jgi:hypothetical protein
MEVWVYFSFTNLFGGEMFWMIIGLFKFMQVVLEYIEEAFFLNMEMMAILGTF